MEVQREMSVNLIIDQSKYSKVKNGEKKHCRKEQKKIVIELQEPA